VDIPETALTEVYLTYSGLELWLGFIQAGHYAHSQKPCDEWAWVKHPKVPGGWTPALVWRVQYYVGFFTEASPVGGGAASSYSGGAGLESVEATAELVGGGAASSSSGGAEAWLRLATLEAEATAELASVVAPATSPS
jgi:hypothetical protein